MMQKREVAHFIVNKTSFSPRLNNNCPIMFKVILMLTSILL